MSILIACEESQRVCIAFRNRGYDAYSCDLLDCSGKILPYGDPRVRRTRSVTFEGIASAMADQWGNLIELS